MKQQTLLLDDVSDQHFLEFQPNVQHAALELMAALILHVYTHSQEPRDESAIDRQ